VGGDCLLKNLQKIDKDTNDIIDEVRDYLFSVGVRTSRERAWDILYNIHKIPYEHLAKKNHKIVYQGQGFHLSHKRHGEQLMVVRNLGRYELKAVSSRKDKDKSPSVRFVPSPDITKIFDEIEIVGDNDV
jgi:hypothetical protein